MASDQIFLRDHSSGRIHRAYRPAITGRLFTDEACNVDDAGGHEEIDEAVIADADEGALCGNCFPRTRQI